jgi:hypothetical protein
LLLIIYAFNRIYAENEIGASDAAAFDSVTTRAAGDVPSAPKNVKAMTTSKSIVHVSWTKPDSNGGSPITGYIIEQRTEGSTCWTQAGGRVLARSLTVDLTSGL